MTEVPKKSYRTWCCEQPDLPIFFQDWWLDAACGSEAWNCCLSVAGDPPQIRGVLPYFLSRRYGFRWIMPPPLTPFLGPWLVYPPGQKASQRHSFEIEVMEDLMQQLPAYTFFVQRWHYQATNWLPFYWKGFRQRTQYSHVIEPLVPSGELFAHFRGAVRTEIRKSEKIYEVYEGQDAGPLHELVGHVFSRQRKRTPFSPDFLSGLHQVAAAHQCGRIYYARREGATEPEAAIFVVWDRESAYLLLTGRSDEAVSGAVSLLIWQAIQDLALVVKRFDFEGSMLRGVEHYFRGFGGELRPYFRVVNGGYGFLEGLREILSKK